MMNVSMRIATLACLTAAGLAAQGTDQDKGEWRAVSSTARGVTGDIALGGSRLTINFATVPMAQIRPLTPEEGAALFDGANGSGSLYKIAIRSDRTFLHKSHLCGEQDTQWMATFVSGKQLQVAFFSNSAAPKLTIDALANSSDLCGTYTYAR